MPVSLEMTNGPANGVRDGAPGYGALRDDTLIDCNIAELYYGRSPRHSTSAETRRNATRSPACRIVIASDPGTGTPKLAPPHHGADDAHRGIGDG